MDKIIYYTAMLSAYLHIVGYCNTNITAVCSSSVLVVIILPEVGVLARMDDACLTGVVVSIHAYI